MNDKAPKLRHTAEVTVNPDGNGNFVHVLLTFNDGSDPFAYGFSVDEFKALAGQLAGEAAKL